MAERNDTAKAQLKVRLREPLRARLEADAKRAGWSLNTEIVRRLEGSIRDENLGAIIFGDEQMFAVMDTLARIMRAIELRAGKRLTDDADTYNLAVETIYRFLKNAPLMIATGTYSAEIRDIADLGALAAIERMIRKDVERRADDA
jgi:hypothetical protein